MKKSFLFLEQNIWKGGKKSFKFLKVETLGERLKNKKLDIGLDFC